MIKSSELRIGNIVWESSSFTPGPDDFEEIIVGAINDIDKVVLDNQNHIYSYDYLYPIPLTPEWLERCGFEKKSNEMQVDGIEMTFHINDSTYFSSCGGLNGSLAVLCLCRGNYFANNLQYLHQLQNLYFALTGEELTIK